MQECFAGGNTRTGFVNYIPAMLEGKNKIWLLKGCPGSGKSSFMRRIAELADHCGYETVVIRCSSDTDSLDGVIIPEKSFAVADATAPHAIAPEYPVAKHREINMAQFTKMSDIDAKTVIELSDGKAMLYKSAYAYLGAACALRDALRQEIKRYILSDKLSAFIKRRTSSLKVCGEKLLLQQETVGKHGIQHLSSFDAADEIYSFYGDADICDVFMNAVIECTHGKAAYISNDMTDSGRISEVYFPENGLLFTSRKIGTEVNLSRFITPEGITNTRRIRRYTAKQTDYLKDAAASCIAEACAMHGEMEKIYTGGTDFKKLEKEEIKLLEEISSVLNG